MAYQRGSLKKAERKEGLTWVLRYRINGKEQTPLVVGMVSDFPTEDDANVEVDRLGLRAQINSQSNIPQGRIKFNELAEFYLTVVTDPTVTASPMDENTMPILKHNVRDYLVAKWGNQIAEKIEPLEIQKWLVSLRTTKIKDATGRVMTDRLALVQSGHLKFLAVTNSRRAPTIPDVPTAVESGFPELAYEGLAGFIGSRGMPAELIERISADVRAVAAEPAVAARLAAVGQVARGTTPAEFAEMIEVQRTKLATIVQETGMKPQR